MAVTGSLENSQKFNRACLQRKLTWGAVVTHIIRYAADQHPNTHDARIAASNLKKELSRTKMSDKVLLKGLRIIGLSDDEIKQTVQPA